MGGILVCAGIIRSRMTGPWDIKEADFPQVAQAVLLGAACLACLVALARARSTGEHYAWWVAPAFITFVMFWREIEIDAALLGFGENAFSWKYLYEGDMPIWRRLVLGIPSTGMAITALLVCLKHARRLWGALLHSRAARVGIVLFALGFGLCVLGQVWDKARYLVEEHGVRLWGVRAHRDDFWEEFLELGGAAAVLLGVVDSLRHRPIIPLAAGTRPGEEP